MTEPTTTDTPATDPTTGTDATAVDAAAQTSAEATFAPTDLVVPAESTSPAPEPEPAAAAPVAPQAITVEVDEQTKALLSQQFVTLSSSVLDAADVASQAAKAANEAGHKFNHASARLTKLSQGMGKSSTIVLVSTATLMLISIGFFTAMGIRLVSKVNQLDATVMTVGKRAVELNTSLESLGLMSEKIAELTVQQEQLAKSQTELEQRIATTLATSTESVQKVPEALAKQMAASTSGVTKQVEGLGAQLKSQAGAVQALSKDVKALQSTVGDVNVLKRDVQALVTLQRERYLEQLQKQAAAAQEAKRPPPVQFPRPAPATSPTAVPGANAPAQ
jgi:hypothetical protein